MYQRLGPPNRLSAPHFRASRTRLDPHISISMTALSAASHEARLADRAVNVISLIHVRSCPVPFEPLWKNPTTNFIKNEGQRRNSLQKL